MDAPAVAAAIPYPAPVNALGPGLGQYYYSGRADGWLKSELSRFDLLVINGIWQYNAVAGYRAAASRRIPYCVFPHGMLDPYFKHAFPLKHLKKSVYWKLILRRVLNEAESVLFTCEQERLLARESFPGYHPREVVVPYGIFPPTLDMDQIRDRFLARYPELAGKRLLLFLGRIHPKKGVNLLLDGFAQSLAQNPDWHLVIAGPDPDNWRHDLDAQARRLGIDKRMSWTGMLDGEMKWGAYRAAELFSLPSHQENFGISVVESLVSGTPVALTDKVNIWREIEADGGGLVGTNTARSIAETLNRWVVLPEADRARMRVNAVACFHKNFNYTQTSRRMLETFQNACGANSRAVCKN